MRIVLGLAVILFSSLSSAQVPDECLLNANAKIQDYKESRLAYSSLSEFSDHWTILVSLNPAYVENWGIYYGNRSRANSARVGQFVENVLSFLSELERDAILYEVDLTSNSAAQSPARQAPARSSAEASQTLYMNWVSLWPDLLQAYQIDRKMTRLNEYSMVYRPASFLALHRILRTIRLTSPYHELAPHFEIIRRQVCQTIRAG